MEKDLDHPKELQLLPLPPPPPPPPSSSFHWLNHHRPSLKPPSLDGGGDFHHNSGPSLDLKLSISPEPVDFGFIESLKLQAAEQIRLATIEKAYAERLKELTTKQIELAHSEFGRARAMWDKTREEVYKAERLRDTATTCVGEITCYSCRKRFRPS